MKRVVVFFLATLIFCLCPVSVSAMEPEDPYGVAPCLENCEQATFAFAVGNGIADFGVSYTGTPATFSWAKLTVKIQKKYLLLFWKTVEIDEPNNEWVRYSYELNDIFYDEFPITETGTYRAVFTLEVTGTGDVVDVLEETIEQEYD